MTDPSSPTGFSRLSRRSLVKTAATAAAAGTALAVAGPAATADADAARPEQVPAARAAEQQPDAGDGVLVRVLDARLGTLEVFTEHGHHTVTDRALAAQLARLGR